MWSSVLLILFTGIVVLRARSVPNDSLEEASAAPPNAQKFWKNGYAGYSTIPLTESSGQPWPEQTRDCNCAPKMRFPRRSKLRAVIRRNDMVLGDPEEALENFLEEYLLRLYLNKGLFSPPVTTAVSTRKISKGKTRTQKQVQSLPAFQHEKAVYSDEENYRISHNSRFYSQEPVPGQLLYPPVSPKFNPVVRPYGTTHVNIQSKPRYVSSMLIPHFLNQSINEPKEIIRNILRASTTTTTTTTPVMTNENDHVTELPKRIRYAKNSGYINSSNWSREKNVISGGGNNTKVQ
ncbi:uncharacterized protein LOC119768032 isoform X1 [Culex quinquefasciatus]|uniref:uncharacterized protein LOC119768032 isoform X1 n=1 Tax=Culex quinquefasciatus TaxID=7176 RepID=UPI0018E3F8D8|nr:uncharacterized protein LOC119768032 isoform X1 [Culex quinquefasciatus]